MLPGLVVGVLAVLSLTGCGAFGLGVRSQTCVDWVSFDSPADAVEEADAVVAGRLVGQSGSATLYGEAAPIWTIDVDKWIKGDGDDQLRVVSTPATCEASPPPDPFLAVEDEDRVIVILHDDPDVGWRSITPWQGIVVAGPDGGVPEVWPSSPTGE
ncbi:hypothetical protein GCM10025773_01970 [Microbacterium jejuense]